MLSGLMVLQRTTAARARSFEAANAQALDALAHGDLERARTTWSTWAASSGAPRIAAMAAHNVAWTLIREGSFARAIATHEANEAMFLPALTALGLSSTSAADRALAHALSGTLPDAERWLALAEERLPDATVPSAGAIALAHAIILCRAGERPAATKLLADGWKRIESTTTGDVYRPLRVVRAFAAGSDTDLASLRPTYPAEYTFLGTAWPEMATFLAAHDLG